MRVNGLIETNQLKVIGSTTTDGVQISNVENNMIAKFYNDYNIVLNGPTNILGALYCSHPIDAYRFSATEIIQRDTNPLLIKNKNNITTIQIDEVAVEIQQHLKVISSTNSSFSYGAGKP